MSVNHDSFLKKTGTNYKTVAGESSNCVQDNLRKLGMFKANISEIFITVENYQKVGTLQVTYCILCCSPLEKHIDVPLIVVLCH